MLAANAPDIDVVTLAAGPAAALHWHRHFTHSFAFAPVLAIALVGLFRLVVRQPIPWAAAWLASIAAIFSHILLDLTNVYGTHAGLPFRTDWMHWDITNVVDFWIWAILLLALFGPVLGRLVTGEITSGKTRVAHFGRGWAVFALSCLCLYEAGRATLHSRALAMLDSRLYEDAAPLRTAAYPNAGNPFTWRGVVEADKSFYLYDLNVTTPFHPWDAAPVRKSGPGNLLPQLESNPEFREFIAFNQAPLWQPAQTNTPGEHALELVDLRFGTAADPGFACRAILTQAQTVAKSECSFGSAGRTFSKGGR